MFSEEATSALAGFHADPLSWSNWNLEMLVFFWREENLRTRRKTFGARREPKTNSTQLCNQAGIEPGPYLWETSAHTSAPSLLPRRRCNSDEDD